MPLPVLLALETSQRTGGVALRTAEGTMHVESLRESKRHDDDLMPAIDRLFVKNGLTPSDLDAIAISIGPGGFTGLRIAVSTAKMFAETLGVQVVAIPSALVAAETMTAHDGPILIALACKRESAWITKLITKNEVWTIDGAPSLMEAASIDFETITVMLADEHLPSSIQEKAIQARVPIVEPAFDPKACLTIADRFLEAGQTIDPLHLNPLYARHPEAVVIWEKRKNDG